MRCYCYALRDYNDVICYMNLYVIYLNVILLKIWLSVILLYKMQYDILISRDDPVNWVYSVACLLRNVNFSSSLDT